MCHSPCSQMGLCVAAACFVASYPLTAFKRSPGKHLETESAFRQANALRKRMGLCVFALRRSFRSCCCLRSVPQPHHHGRGVHQAPHLQCLYCHTHWLRWESKCIRRFSNANLSSAHSSPSGVHFRDVVVRMIFLDRQVLGMAHQCVYESHLRTTLPWSQSPDGDNPHFQCSEQRSDEGLWIMARAGNSQVRTWRRPSANPGSPRLRAVAEPQWCRHRRSNGP